MNTEHLSKRLAKVAEYVKQDARLADIGTDHAYLPCFLVKEQIISFAVASDIVSGPYESARQNVQEAGLDNQISVRLASGTDSIQSEDRIDTVTICGMGGDLIKEILQTGKQKGQLDTVKHLILQPNVGEYSLRIWLMDNSYTITDEAIIKENDKYYEVIVAIPSDTIRSYSELELRHGIYLSKSDSAELKEKWHQQLEKLEYIKEQILKGDKVDAAKILEIDQQIELLGGLIDD